MLQEQFKNTLKQLILSQRTVDAIKLIRTYTGMGLQDSKDLYDLLSQNPEMLDSYNFEVSKHEINTGPLMTKKDLNESMLFEIKKLLSEDSKAYAVSYLKEMMNISLQNAEIIVKEIEDSGKGTIAFKAAEEIKSYQSESNNSTQSEKTVDEKPVKKSLDTGIPSIPYTHTINKPKHKPSVTQQPLSQPIVFAKMELREKNRKRNRSNSGCMVTLVMMIVFGLSLVWLLS